jgi:hypothetical protein
MRKYIKKKLQYAPRETEQRIEQIYKNLYPNDEWQEQLKDSGILYRCFNNILSCHGDSQLKYMKNHIPSNSLILK